MKEQPHHGAPASVRRGHSTPNLSSLMVGELEAIAAPTGNSPGRGSGSSSPHSSTTPSLQVSVTGATMTLVAAEGSAEELATFFEVSVRIGQQELSGARRRFREFHKLYRELQKNYPHLIGEYASGSSSSSSFAHEREFGHSSGGSEGEGSGEPADAASAVRIPPFPKKHLFRAAWDPEVVVERVQRLGVWLSAVTAKLQFASLELVSFLNIPLYAAIRLLSGDLQVSSSSSSTRLSPSLSSSFSEKRNSGPPPRLSDTHRVSLLSLFRPRSHRTLRSRTTRPTLCSRSIDPRRAHLPSGTPPSRASTATTTRSRSLQERQEQEEEEEAREEAEEVVVVAREAAAGLLAPLCARPR